MEHPNNGYGVSGGAAGANTERKVEGTTTQPRLTGMSTSNGQSETSRRATGSASSLFPPRLYSFQALVAMGVLGFMVGRICR